MASGLLPIEHTDEWVFSSMECPICHESFTRDEMNRTVDCHGIPYRLVCHGCYIDIMDDKGFDGEEYDESDECIEEDY